MIYLIKALRSKGGREVFGFVDDGGGSWRSGSSICGWTTISSIGLGDSSLLEIFFNDGLFFLCWCCLKVCWGCGFSMTGGVETTIDSVSDGISTINWSSVFGRRESRNFCRVFMAFSARPASSVSQAFFIFNNSLFRSLSFLSINSSYRRKKKPKETMKTSLDFCTALSASQTTRNVQWALVTSIVFSTLSLPVLFGRPVELALPLFEPCFPFPVVVVVVVAVDDEETVVLVDPTRLLAELLFDRSSLPDVDWRLKAIFSCSLSCSTNCHCVNVNGQDLRKTVTWIEYLYG